jgi:PPM family protein phosphatase
MGRAIFHRVDLGRLRNRNDDVVLVDEGLGLAIVADGVGGHRAGDRAAALAAGSLLAMLQEQTWAVEAVRRKDPRVDKEDLARFVRHALQRASQAIFAEAQASPERAGMSTTTTLVLDLDGRALVAHVGDSRGYLLRGGEVLRLTEDHVVSTAVKSADGAQKPVKKRVLSRAVGNTAAVQVDVMWVDLLPEDRVLLCSDGLSDNLFEDDEVLEAVTTFGAAAAPEVLVDLANTRGGRDNISVALLDTVSTSASQAQQATQARDWPNLREQLRILRELAPFRQLSYLELEALRAHARVDHFPASTIIAYPRETPQVAVLVRGAVELNCASGAPLLLGPGSIIGETTLVHEGEWPYVALTKHDVTLVRFPAEVLRGFLQSRPRASSKVLWEFFTVSGTRLAEVASPSTAA